MPHIKRDLSHINYEKANDNFRIQLLGQRIHFFHVMSVWIKIFSGLCTAGVFVANLVGTTKIHIAWIVLFAANIVFLALDLWTSFRVKRLKTEIYMIQKSIAKAKRIAEATAEDVDELRDFVSEQGEVEPVDLSMKIPIMFYAIVEAMAFGGLILALVTAELI